MIKGIFHIAQLQNAWEYFLKQIMPIEIFGKRFLGSLLKMYFSSPKPVLKILSLCGIPAAVFYLVRSVTQS